MECIFAHPSLSIFEWCVHVLTGKKSLKFSVHCKVFNFQCFLYLVKIFALSLSDYIQRPCLETFIEQAIFLYLRKVPTTQTCFRKSHYSEFVKLSLLRRQSGIENTLLVFKALFKVHIIQLDHIKFAKSPLNF